MRNFSAFCSNVLLQIVFFFSLLFFLDVRSWRSSNFSIVISIVSIIAQSLLSCVNYSILLFGKRVMCSPVQGELASLLKFLSAAIDTTNERLIVCMSMLVLPQILWQSKFFGTESTHQVFLVGVNEEVSF